MRTNLKDVKCLAIYNNNCRLKGYEDYRDWFLAWEVYKYLYRNVELLVQDKYRKLNEVAEDIVVWHKLGNDPKSKYEDILDFYRFYITLAKNEDEHNFVLTDEIEEYLYFIKKECEDWIVRNILSFVFGEKE